MADGFFDGDYNALHHTLVIGACAYLVAVFLLRISGKRTLTKWNAFDLVVTVALGSTLASILVTKSISLAQGALAIAVLVTMQFLLTWLAAHSEGVQKLIKARPSLIFFKGEFLREAMRRERVTESEILAAIRGEGIADLESVAAVVLETDGSVSVIRDLGNGSSLRNVEGMPQQSDF